MSALCANRVALAGLGLALGSVGWTSPARAQAYAAATPHQPTSYQISLVTSDTGSHMLGEVETGWRLATVNPVEMWLDSTMRVVRVLVDGKPNTRLSRTMYARPAAQVVVPHEKAPGDTLTTRVRYHGTPAGGFRVGHDRAGRRALAGETAGGHAREWLPVPDGEPARVTVGWTVQADTGQRVVASGTLVKVDTLSYGHTGWQFRLDQPVPLDALAVAAGYYAVTSYPGPTCASGPCAVSVWTTPEDSAAAARGAFRRAGEIATWMSRLLGPLPSPGLTHVASVLAPAGRPAAAVVLWDEARVHDGSITEREVAEATAAQWFGVAVSEHGAEAERPSPFVASYLAELWLREAAGGKAPHPSAAMPPRQIASLQQLHKAVGDSVFFRGLRRYVESHRNTTAAPGDLAGSMSEAAGHPITWSLAAGLGR